MSHQREVNISKSNIANKCDLKCAYSYQYPESNITAKNNDINISLTYENGNKPPVIFNNNKYTVHQINLFAPSLHQYNGIKVPGELVIVHVPELGGPDLIVCIPILQSGDYTAATDLITQVINNVSTNAPSKGESTNLNISNFSLQHIVPKKPFIYYSGTYNQGVADFIVFPTVACIPLTQTTLNKLSSIVKPFSLVMNGGNLFLNSKGPNSGMKFKNDDIYISCKPTGASEEKSYITQPSTNTSSTTNLFDSPAFMNFLKLFIICFVFIIFFLGINYAFNSFTKLDIKISDVK